MGKPKVLKLQAEVEDIMHRFASNKFMMAQAFLQIIHRENIITGNRLRKRFGEPEIIPEPVMYKDNSRRANLRTRVEWVIPVPTSWVSMTGLPDPTPSSESLQSQGGKMVQIKERKGE